MKTQLEKGLLAVLLTVWIVACSTLGVSAPQTFNEKAAAAIVTVTGARQTTLTLLQAHKITPDDAENVQGQADNLHKGIDVARSLKGADPSGAQTKLDATVEGLKILTAYLEAHR